MRHYTTYENAEKITSDGFIRPSLDGQTYLTPDEYSDGAGTQEKLALSRQPDGYFEVPISHPPTPTPVSPTPEQPGGGLEVGINGPVGLPSGASFTPF